MIVSKLLLDGAVFDKESEGRTVKKLFRETRWLIKINQYRVLVEMDKHSKRKNYDVSVYDTSTNSYKHFIIWNHCFQRYVERTQFKRRSVILLHIIKQVLLEGYTVSKVTNVHYYNSDDEDLYNVFAYDMTKDGILMYKTFFKRAKNISA